MKAFPLSNMTGLNQQGMDLRDYFAAAALQGLLSNPKLQAQILNTGGAWGSWVPESAYGWADAMMKARNETP